jgi:hypothetical protein
MKVLSRYSFGQFDENHENHQVRIACNIVQIQTRYVSNINPERYRHMSLTVKEVSWLASEKETGNYLTGVNRKVLRAYAYDCNGYGSGCLIQKSAQSWVTSNACQNILHSVMHAICGRQHETSKI